ncbi:MAG: hypothetical protein P4L99_27250 [Chthoniobacter sp.]|nr:hypothetical protein [Chthoniobacter sp.]
MARIVHDNLGRAKHFITTRITTPNDFEDDVIGLPWIAPYRDSLVPVRVERLPQCLDGLDAVAMEQPSQLLERHLHALMQLLG